ncbi:MAG: Transcriptional regulator, AcrR family [Firmicutes bacterium]|nr:Transcriptional regulator, AcrR family [Bacillota bacterium]MDI6705038.1 TetR/AcrR family transcriptional regulator [Bacillota bacterium]
MPSAKDGDVKQALLNAATELFYEQGYDNTSVNSIIEKVGVSKGAFYHYFKSKEDVLEAVANRHIESEIKITHEAAEDSRLNAVEKINRIINDVLVHKALNMEERQKLSGMFEHEGNIKFLRKIAENKIKMLRLPYRVIIEQGIREGSFTVSFPEEAAEQIIHMLITLNSVVTRLASGIEERPGNVEIIRRKIGAYREAIERILGAEEGSISFSEAAGIFGRLVNQEV